jgi:polar amino acid transport system substrate-binding protein/glutamate/aspartate transport system substrate-binding protein
METGTIRLGYRTDAAPFSTVDADGRPKGYSIDLCYRIVSGIRNDLGMPITIEWVKVTSTDRFQQVADGNVDVECGSSDITLSRLKLVDFSAMIWIDDKTFLVRRGQSIKSMDDLANKKVAVAEGSTSETVLREALLGQVLRGGKVTAQVVVVEDRFAGLDALLKGSVDAVVGDRAILAGLLRNAPNGEQLALSDYHLAYQPYGLVVRRNDADFRYAVNRVLAQLYRTDEVEQIYNRWFDKQGPRPPLLDSLYDLNGLRD